MRPCNNLADVEVASSWTCLLVGERQSVLCRTKDRILCFNIVAFILMSRKHWEEMFVKMRLLSVCELWNTLSVENQQIDKWNTRYWDWSILLS